jgi:hypothetical protein
MDSNMNKITYSNKNLFWQIEDISLFETEGIENTVVSNTIVSLYATLISMAYMIGLVTYFSRF